jgi:hypothetical protein
LAEARVAKKKYLKLCVWSRYAITFTRYIEGLTGLPDILVHATHQNGKIYEVATKYTKWT